MYFYCPELKLTQWDRPPKPQDAPAPTPSKLTLPPEVTARHLATTTTTTTTRHASPASVAHPLPSPPLPCALIPHPCQEHYVAHVDMSTGRTFYKNVQTGATTWEAPDPLRRRSTMPVTPFTQEALRRESAIVAATMSPPVRASVYQGSAT